MPRLQIRILFSCVSVACGMTAFDPETDETLRSVYKRADVRMYDDKRAKKGIQHA